MTRSHIIEAVGLFLLLCGTVGFLLHWYVIDWRYWFRRANDLPGPGHSLTPALGVSENVRAGELQDVAWDDHVREDPEGAALDLIAEWHAPDLELTAEDWIARDLADLELLAWDARVQAARCWEIVHVEFPRLRAELCAA